MKVGINLRLLDPGKIGGMEVYITNLLDCMLLCDETLEYLLFTTAENSHLFQYDTARAKKRLVNHNNSNPVIKDALKKEKLDLYFCPLFILEPLDIDVPAVINIPDVQHEIFPEYFTPETLTWRKMYLQPSGKIADAVITLSDFSKATIAERLEIDKEKIHTIYLSAENRYENKLDVEIKEQVRKKYQLPNVFGFYPANTWPHKNHRNLVLALDLYRNKYGESPSIVLTGSEGEGHGDLVRLIKKYDLANTITHLGYIEKDDMPYLYGNATFVVFPSLFEGFGMPVLEAMHVGCPVACSNTTSLPEVAGEAALYFDPESVEQIADAIYQMITEQPTRNCLVEKGKEQIKKFSWITTARETIDVFHEAVKKSKFNNTDVAPLVSIITPSFNQGIFIEETINSVLSQDYPNIEYIIVDGGSTDHTLTILKKYQDKLKWFSEPDRGQADAINKGMRMAKGRIVGWLNSDDTYLPRAISKIVTYFSNNPDKIMVYGEGLHVNKEGVLIDRYPTLPFDLKTLAEKCYLCQPTVFLRSAVLPKMGYLNTSLQTCMDYDLWIRIGRVYADRIGFLNDYLANSRLYEEAKTLSMREVVYSEIISTVKKYYGYVPMTWIYGYIHDIIEPEYLKEYGDRSRWAKLVLLTSYMFKCLALTKSIHALVGVLRYFIKRRSPFTSVYSDRWVSRSYETELENPTHLGNIRVRGKHFWPYKSPLIIKISADGILLRKEVVSIKGDFSFDLQLSEDIRKHDSIRLTIRSNKTFIPYKHKMNSDTRELSFILSKVELF